MNNSSKFFIIMAGLILPALIIEGIVRMIDNYRPLEWEKVESEVKK